MTRILITGGAGFLGANLTRKLLEENEDIHLILSPKTNTWRINSISNKLSIHTVDLTDKEKVETTIKTN